MLGVCEESVPPSAPETQKRQGKFPSDCEKMFFKTSSHNNSASATVFAARARAYILAYHKIRQEQLTSSSTTDVDSTASPVNVEKLLKRFKTHRYAIDFDSSFCKAVFHSDDGENVSGSAISS